MERRVCIIGSGLGGLTCGVILAKNGYDVTVLEQGTQVGGCLQCFTRHGARFETGMHFIGSAAKGQTMHTVMRYLGLTDDVVLQQLDTTGYDVVVLGGQLFRFANGREPFIEQMAHYFPRQKDQLARYFDTVQSVARASSLSSMRHAESNAPLNTGYMTRSTNSVIDQLVSDPLLAKVLVGTLPLYAAERDKTPFATHAFVMDFYNQSAFRIVGGSDSIARSLVRTIERHGGQVLTRQQAVRIVCDDTHAIGVETDKELFFPADYVISDAHPMRTLELVCSRLIRPAFRNRINAIPQTIGVFSAYIEFKENAMPYMNHNYYGYNTDTPWGCDHYDEQSWPKGFLYMHFPPTSGPPPAPPCEGGESIPPSPTYARTGVILSYMQWSDVEQWAGTTVGCRGSDYEAFKQRKAQQLIASLERHFPGISSKIKRIHTSTPLTYRDYTGTERGSMYGCAKDIGMGAAGRVPHRTKIPNLLQTGQNINSHGMQGVIVGTIVTCSELLTAEKIYRQMMEK